MKVVLDTGNSKAGDLFAQNWNRVRGPRLRLREIQRSLTEPFNFGDFFLGQLLRWVVGRFSERDPVPVVQLRVIEFALVDAVALTYQSRVQDSPP